MEPLDTIHSIPQWLANEIGLLMPTPLEELEAIHGEYDREYYQMVFGKGYFNDPRNENGEVPF